MSITNDRRNTKYGSNQSNAKILLNKDSLSSIDSESESIEVPNPCLGNPSDRSANHDLNMVKSNSPKREQKLMVYPKPFGKLNRRQKLKYAQISFNQKRSFKARLKKTIVSPRIFIRIFHKLQV